MQFANSAASYEGVSRARAERSARGFGPLEAVDEQLDLGDAALAAGLDAGDGSELTARDGQRDHRHVVEVAGALPRIVGQEHVAVGHRGRRILVQEMPHRFRH